MARVAQALTCTPEEKIALIQLSRSRSEEARLVERAKIVLLCLEGKRNDEVAQELSIRPNTVGVWRKRFFRTRDPGSPGSGAFRKACDLRTGAEKPDSVSAGTISSGGLARWDGGTLVQVLGVSDDIVWRILRKEGIQLARRRSWFACTDPESGRDSALLRHPPSRNPAYDFHRTGLGPLRSSGSLQSRRSTTNALFSDGSAEASVELSLDLPGLLALGEVLVPVGMKRVGKSFDLDMPSDGC